MINHRLLRYYGITSLRLIIIGGIFYLCDIRAAEAQSLFVDFDPSRIPRILARLSCYFVQFAMIAFGVAIISAGVMFVLARGNPTLFEKAKKTLLYSVLGGIIIYGVYTIIMSVGSVVGVNELLFIPLTCS